MYSGVEAIVGGGDDVPRLGGQCCQPGVPRLPARCLAAFDVIASCGDDDNATVEWFENPAGARWITTQKRVDRLHICVVSVRYHLLAHALQTVAGHS